MSDAIELNVKQDFEAPKGATLRPADAASKPWKVLRDADGPIGAGYCDFTPGDGQEVVELAGPDPDVMLEIKARVLASAPQVDLATHNLETIKDPVLRAVVAHIQEALR